MKPQTIPTLKTFRGILTLREGTWTLCLICNTGDEMVIYETPRTNGLRHFLWQPVNVTGMVHSEGSDKILEVVDFSSEEEPPETVAIEDDLFDRRLAYDGEPLPFPGFAENIAC